MAVALQPPLQPSLFLRLPAAADAAGNEVALVTTEPSTSDNDEEDMMEDGQPAGQKRRRMLMMKRSRSLPQEEFIYLSGGSQDSQLIRRTDSVISGHSTTRY